MPHKIIGLFLFWLPTHVVGKNFLTNPFGAKSPVCPLSCDGSNCDDNVCAGCEFVCGQPKCDFGKGLGNNTLPNPRKDQKACSVTNFRAVTKEMIQNDPSFFRSRSFGRPAQPETAPNLVDLNGDGYLDVVQLSHFRVMALALPDRNYQSRNYDDDDPPFPKLKDITASNFQLLDGSADTHGSIIADLDNDGTMDILSAVGGGLGGVRLSNERDAWNTRNLLMWGSKGEDGIVFFRGGRENATEAGLEGHLRRGRMNYLLDVNGDGLLDVFLAGDPPHSDHVVPGILYINQGNRTWAETEVREYSKTILLTDLDGDGIANELVITRDYCFPEHDPPYPESVLDFCATRPVGTTAVYKYNTLTKEMEDIGRHYAGITPDFDKNPKCCAPGQMTAFFEKKNCYVHSAATADLDGDSKADQIFLFATKIEFYFSSEREKGDLPFGGSSSHGNGNGDRLLGARINLPARCTGKAIRVLDLDNDGTEEILVGCVEAGQYLLYTPTSKSMKKKTKWTLANGCNVGQSGNMGDLNAVQLMRITEEDGAEACQRETKLCLVYNGTMKNKLRLDGLSVGDLNNDGFLDLLAAHYDGHYVFLKNDAANLQKKNYGQKNQMIAFKLQGDPKKGINKYGIGSTIFLHSHNCGVECDTQFREISSYQHATDKHGYKDDRIFFGLGRHGNPLSVTVRWPNGHKQKEDLMGWNFVSGFHSASNPIVITYRQKLNITMGDPMMKNQRTHTHYGHKQKDHQTHTDSREKHFPYENSLAVNASITLLAIGLVFLVFLLVGRRNSPDDLQRETYEMVATAEMLDKSI